MPRPDSHRGEKPKPRLPVSELLDQIRSHWEDAQVHSAELAAENDRLRWHLHRAKVFHNAQQQDTQDSLDSPASRTHSGQGPMSVSDWYATLRGSSGPSASAATSIAPSTASVLALEDKDRDMPPVNRRRRPSLPTLSPTARLPTAPPKPGEDVLAADGIFESEVPDATPRSTSATSGQGGLSKSESDESNGESKRIGTSLAVLKEWPENSQRLNTVQAAAFVQMEVHVPKEADAGSRKTSKVSRADTRQDSKNVTESLSLGNEEDLPLHPIWLERRKRTGGSMARRKSFAASGKSQTLAGLGPRYNGTLKEITKGRNLVLNPNGTFLMTWDFFIIVVLVYDLIFVPLQAFELPTNTLFSVMELVATSIWTTDMFLSFFKGVELHGQLEMRHNKIVHRYVTSWFLFDLTVVFFDWFLLISMNQGNMVDALWFSRVRRLVRLMRLFRLLKHGRRFLSVLNLIRSENWLVIFRIVWLMLALVGINHFVCCGWYAIGAMDDFTERWTDNAFQPEDSMAYRYSTSFHWSVTQFTPASMEVVPANALERAYCVGSIFFGLLVFSAFVSNMTNSMTYLTRIQYQKGQQKELLRRYIDTKNLSMELGNDVINQFGISNSKRAGKRLLEKDISCLADMPHQLLERLHFEVHAPVLEVHPLLKVISDKDPLCLRALCHNAADEVAYMEGEEIFRFGQRCKSMMLVVAGQFNYIGGFGDMEQVCEGCGPGWWFCEACLWVKWEHRGCLTAASDGCELAVLDMAEVHLGFGRSMLHKELRSYAREYAYAAIRESGGADRVNDIWGQKERVSVLVEKIFKDMEDVEAAAAKILSISGPDRYSHQNCFKAWRHFTRRETRLRRGGVQGVAFRLLHRAGLLDRLCLPRPPAR